MSELHEHGSRLFGSVRAAFSFLSRLPVGGFPFSAQEWRWAPAHFPAVGIAVGGAAALVFAVARSVGLSPLSGATLTVVAAVLFTGALHEDGLADSCDGLGGAHGGKRALEIMKDSRIGSYGAAGLVLGLLLRITSIAELPDRAWFALILIHCLARVGPVWLMALLPHLSLSNLTGTNPVVSTTAASLVSLFDVKMPQIAAAFGWGLACAAAGMAFGWLSPASAGAALLALVLCTACSAVYFRRAIGGVTGDLLGMAEQITEIAASFALVVTLA